jgi:hypothetical protein
VDARERAHLQERAVAVQQELDALAREQLPSLFMARDVPLAAPGGGLREVLTQRRDPGEVVGAVLRELLVAEVDPAGQELLVASANPYAARA